MNGRDFREMVEADPELKLTKCIEGEEPTDVVIEIQFTPVGGGHRLHLAEILRAPRAELLALLRFERTGAIMKHFNGGGRTMGRPSLIRSLVPRLLAA